MAVNIVIGAVAALGLLVVSVVGTLLFVDWWEDRVERAVHAKIAAERAARAQEKRS